MNLDSPSVALLRTEFALTIANHYLFVPTSIGLIILVAILESISIRTKNEAWVRAARFWGAFFLLSWFFGFITGLPLRWQLTHNWNGFEAYINEILEQILMLEAYIAPVMLILICLFYFGWTRLNSYLHCAITWSLAALLCLQASAMLVLNGWMQHPVGASFGPERATITSLSAIFFNPMAIDKIGHAIAAAIATGCMFVLSVSAWYCLTKTHLAFARRSIKIATSLGFLASLFIVYSGHSSTYNVAEFQPLKFAAIEGVWNTTPSPVPLTLFGIPDVEHGNNRYELKIPSALSVLMGKDDSYSVMGIRDILKSLPSPAEASGRSMSDDDHLPNVPLLFFSYRVMVLSGGMMFVLFTVGLLYSRKVLRGHSPLMLRITIASAPLPWIGTLAGWIVAEAGRQPWLVYGVLLTKNATSIAPPALDLTLLAFAAIAYALMTGASLVISWKFIRSGPVRTTPKSRQPSATYPGNDDLLSFGASPASRITPTRASTEAADA